MIPVLYYTRSDRDGSAPERKAVRQRAWCVSVRKLISPRRFDQRCPPHRLDVGAWPCTPDDRSGLRPVSGYAMAIPARLALHPRRAYAEGDNRVAKMTRKRHGTQSRSQRTSSQSGEDSPPAQQLELDFRAPVFKISWPDPETVAFWHATADDPQEFARRIAKFSRRMQAFESGSPRNQERVSDTETEPRRVCYLIRLQRNPRLGRFSHTDGQSLRRNLRGRTETHGVAYLDSFMSLRNQNRSAAIGVKLDREPFLATRSTSAWVA